MRILFSEAYSLNIKVPSGPFRGHEIVAQPRGCDWAMRGLRKYFHHIYSAIRVLVQARNYDGLILCTAGIESFIVCRWRRAICPRTRVVCADVLVPRPGILCRLVRSWLKHAFGVACIRRGDISMLGRRFGVAEAKCRFVAFPVEDTLAQSAEESDYIYAAGWAHRDWPTLIEALSVLPYRAVLAPGRPLELPDHLCGRVQVIPMPSPEEGRRLMAGARLAVLSFEETDLPSGPLVLLDAMVMGKAVVCTSVNGSRDYIEDGRTGLLVPPQRADPMAKAIQLAMENHQLRMELGRAARNYVINNCTTEQFMAQTIALLER